MALDAKKLASRPLYVDEPFEDMAFRVDTDNNVFFKTYGGDEIDTTWKNRVFQEALISGDIITKEEYDAK